MSGGHVRIVFETHAVSEDNERGLATGWLPGRLSERGRALAAELGERRRGDGISAVFTSDLRRAVETAEIALGDTGISILHDWRLRECDYGDLNGTPAAALHLQLLAHVDSPYPGGESWREAVQRIESFLDDLVGRWDGARVLVIGHRATLWALAHQVDGVPLETLAAAPFVWREGWEFELER